MQSYIFRLVDDRIADAMLKYVTVHDLERAIELASEQLVMSAHLQTVTISQGGLVVCRLDRSDLDDLGDLDAAAGAAPQKISGAAP